MLTRILPMIYPNHNCKKNHSPRYAKPGRLINVNTEVSVATIESMETGHGKSLPAKK